MNLLPFEQLSLSQQVAQLFVIRSAGYLFDHQIRYPSWEPVDQTLKYLICDLGVGGVILSGGSAAEIALKTRKLQSWSNIGLLIAADVEEGVGQRFSGATWFPPLMSYSAIAAHNHSLAIEYVTQVGAITAKESLDIGINWLFAPVVDVNNNPLNPVINVRSFGDNPQLVSELGTAFIAGSHQYPILTTAKHFPGHGDTDIDSHLELPTINHSPQRLAQLELIPFEKAIRGGVDAIMTAHLIVSAWDQSQPATLSHRILTQELRQNLGFEGLIVTDALVMGAIANQYDPAIAPRLALEAGADILLMPSDPVAGIKAICDAVEQGEIPHERILESLNRIWSAKAKVQNATRPLDSIFELASSKALDLSNKILQSSLWITGTVPISPINSGRNLIIIDQAFDARFLTPQCPAIKIPHKQGYQLEIFDTARSSLELTPKPTIIQLFIRGNPFRGNTGLTNITANFIEQLLLHNSLQAVIIYGSPYSINYLPKLTDDIPYLFCYGQMEQAQTLIMQALFGINHM